jgi:O-antigen/teichoic acid export membrane protein
LAITIQVLLGQIVGGGLPTALTRAFFDAPDSSRDEAGRQLIVSTVLVACGATLIVGLSTPLWIGRLASGDAYPLAVAIGLAVPAAVSGAALGLLRVQERPAAYLSITLLGSIGAQIAGVGALLAADGGAGAYLSGYGSAVCVGAVLGLALTGSIGTAPASRQFLRASLAIGLPTIPIASSNYVLSTGDRFVIQVMDGSAAVGRYQVAYALGTLALTFLSALNIAWVPITFASPADERWPVLSRMTTLMVHIAALLCAVVALAAPIALGVMAPASYTTSELAPVTALVALAAVPWAVVLGTGQILLWQRDLRPMLWIAPLAAILNLGLVALLLPPFGLVGAGAATLVALTIQAVLLCRSASRQVSIRWDYRGITAGATMGATAVVVAVVLPATWPADILRVVAALAAGALVVRTVRKHLLVSGADSGAA